MHVADAVAGLALHKAALGKVSGVPASPEVSSLMRLRLQAAVKDLEDIVGDRVSNEVLTPEHSETVVRASLRMQCVLAPNSLMPPAACLLI